MVSSSLKLLAVRSACLALVVGLLQAMPLAGTTVSQRALSTASRGMAAFQGVSGYAPSWTDGMAARLWRMGGATALTWGEFAAVMFGWTVCAFAILVAVGLAARWVKNPRLRAAIPWGVAAILVAMPLPAVWRRATSPEKPIFDLRLIGPVELAQSLGADPASRVFANPSAQSQLLLFSPPSAGGVTLLQAAAFCLNPPAWRNALRQGGWNTVVLSGPIGEFRPLLEHLLTSPDWRLSSVTNHGYLFQRGAGAPARSLDPKTFRLGPDRETAIYLAQIAERYDAIRRPGDARQCLDRALELAPDDVTVLSHAATFAAGRKQWQDAITFSGRALAKDPQSAHAKLVRALALLEIGEALKAQNLCDEILAQAPNDLYTLFLYARICRTLHDYNQEAATLEKIITLSERAGLSTLHYRIYLGQAYARVGQPGPALKNYRLVLESGLLPPNQAEEIRDAISTIEQNAPKE